MNLNPLLNSPKIPESSNKRVNDKLSGGLITINPDAIILVAYRVNAKKGVPFRIWITQRLHEHLTQAYSINQQRFEKNAEE